jgi:hypothetical protein
MNIIDISRILHSTAVEYAFFSAAHRTFSKINHISGYLAHHNKYKRN